MAARGAPLALSGKRPPAPLIEALKARKPEVLAYLQTPVKEDPAPVPASPHTVAAGHGAPVEGLGGVGVAPHHTPPWPPRPDWEQIAAQPGHCGSCAHAQDAPDWGPLMVACGCAPVAWWPQSVPLAVHVGAVCGAYLHPGETVGRGYRAKASGPAWSRA